VRLPEIITPLLLVAQVSEKEEKPIGAVSGNTTQNPPCASTTLAMKAPDKEKDMLETSISETNSISFPVLKIEQSIEAPIEVEETLVLEVTSKGEQDPHEENNMSERSISVVNSTSLPSLEILPNIEVTSDAKQVRLPEIITPLLLVAQVSEKEEKPIGAVSGNTTQNPPCASTTLAMKAPDKEKDMLETSISETNSISFPVLKIEQSIEAPIEVEETLVLEVTSKGDAEHNLHSTANTSLTVEASNEADNVLESSISGTTSTSHLVVEVIRNMKENNDTRHVQLQETKTPPHLAVTVLEDKNTLHSCILSTDTPLLPTVKESIDKKQTWFQNFFVCCIGKEEGYKEGVFRANEKCMGLDEDDIGREEV